MTSGIRDCLPPVRNPRKPNVQLPKRVDRHPRPRVRAGLPALSRPRLQPSRLDAGRPQAPARHARHRPRGVHAALGLRHRQFRHPERHGGSQRADAGPGAGGGGDLVEHQGRRTRRARQGGRARRAAQHRQQGRHADSDERDPQPRRPHRAVRLAYRVPVSRQGHRRIDADIHRAEGADVDRATSPISRPPPGSRRPDSRRCWS